MLPAHERSSYTAEKAAEGSRKITKEYEFTTKDSVHGRPLLRLTGRGAP